MLKCWWPGGRIGDTFPPKGAQTRSISGGGAKKNYEDYDVDDDDNDDFNDYDYGDGTFSSSQRPQDRMGTRGGQ